MKQVGFFEMIMNHKNQFPFYKGSKELIDSPTLKNKLVERKLEFKSHDP